MSAHKLNVSGNDSTVFSALSVPLRGITRNVLELTEITGRFNYRTILNVAPPAVTDSLIVPGISKTTT